LPVKKYLLEEATDIIKDHQRQFEPDLTQEQTDRLLKKLLYEKLCVRRKTKKERHTKKRKKHDKRKTKNIRVRQIVSSSSSSDSDSGSDDSYSE
jgi:non-homologous end joining protein Ku